MSAAPVLRAGRDEDADGFISLIGDCWAEYPGNILDVDGELPELRALASYFSDAGGMLWAATRYRWRATLASNWASVTGRVPKPSCSTPMVSWLRAATEYFPNDCVGSHAMLTHTVLNRVR